MRVNTMVFLAVLPGATSLSASTPPRRRAPGNAARPGRTKGRGRSRAPPSEAPPSGAAFPLRVLLFHKPFGVLSDAFHPEPGSAWRGLSSFFPDDPSLQPAGVAAGGCGCRRDPS